MEDFNLMESPPADLAPKQLLEWSVREWDTREAVINGLQNRIDELKMNVAGLKHRQDITKDRIEKLMEKVGGKISVPGAGTPFFRTTPETLEIEDEVKAIAWSKAHAPYLIKLVESLDKVGYKQEARIAYRDQDVLLPGVSIKEESKSLSIRRA